VWYRFPPSDKNPHTRCDDSFAIATLFLAMQAGQPLVIHGKVSPSLLANLEEFAAIWARWKPDRYHAVAISADREEEPDTGAPEEALVAFSGGIDCCYTAYRHAKGLAGRQSKKVTAGLMVHGFDISLEDTRAFDAALQGSQRMLDSLGMALVPLATNWRQLPIDWNDGHGAALGAALSLFGWRFRYGLIGSGEPYELLPIPWGSTPLTDPLFSSATFAVLHDGAAASRTEKVAVISQWADGCRHLRVCWEGEHKDRNCGCCEKCMRTVLNFRAAGVSCPPCFGHVVTNKMIGNIRINSIPQYNELVSIVAYAETAGRGNQDWAKVLRRRLNRYKKRHGKTPFCHDLRAAIALRTRLKRLSSGLHLSELVPGRRVSHADEDSC
jgi:hypothetical protein